MGVEGSERPAAGSAEPWLVVVLLACAAWFEPVPLYLLALGGFGLAHVLSEIAWIRHTYGRALPRAFWITVGGVLGLQALSRLWSWASGLAPEVLVAVDLVTLSAAILAALWAVRAVRRPLAAAIASVGFALLVLCAVRTDNAVYVMAALAVAHNLTPVALTPPHLRWKGAPLRRLLLGLFAVPCVWLLWRPAPGAAPQVSSALPPEVDLLAGSPEVATWLVGPVVLAQCLHYYAVIRLLPAAGPATVFPVSLRVVLPGVAACVALCLYFLHDHPGARSLYAVAAGAHAWLEWPIIVLALGGGVSHRARVLPSIRSRRSQA